MYRNYNENRYQNHDNQSQTLEQMKEINCHFFCSIFLNFPVLKGK